MMRFENPSLLYDHLDKARSLLRRGHNNSAFTELSHVPPGELAVYKLYVAWADLAVQAYVLAGRFDELEKDLLVHGTACNISSIHDLPPHTLSNWVLLLQEEGRNDDMRALLDRWVTNAYDKALYAATSSSNSLSSLSCSAGPSLPSPHLPPVYNASAYAAAYSEAYLEYDGEGGSDTLSVQPSQHFCPWLLQTTLAGVRAPLDGIETHALARLYVENCLSSTFDDHESAAEWLDGPVGRMLMHHEATHKEIFDTMVEQIPNNHLFAADLKKRKESNATLCNRSTQGSTIRAVWGRWMQNVNVVMYGLEGSVPEGSNVSGAAATALTANYTKEAAQSSTMSAAVLVPLKPLLQGLAVPVGKLGSWLTAVRGALLTLSPSTPRSVSAPGNITTAAPFVDAHVHSLSDDGGTSSSRVAQQNTILISEPVTGQADAADATISTALPLPLPLQADEGYAEGRADVFDFAAKVMITALAAWLVVCGVKEQRRNSWAAAKRVMLRELP